MINLKRYCEKKGRFTEPFFYNMATYTTNGHWLIKLHSYYNPTYKKNPVPESIDRILGILEETRGWVYTLCPEFKEPAVGGVHIYNGVDPKLYINGMYFVKSHLMVLKELPLFAINPYATEGHLHFKFYGGEGILKEI